jgi:hypothetical protein
MAKLIESQIKFLKSYGIDKKETFDASGYSKSEYRVKMDELSLKIAYGVTPCAKAGHTLRTKYGQCIQCHPKFIVFQKRNDDGGVVYVAFSNEESYIKIGCTKNIKTRAKTLREQNYGGYSDWTISFSKDVPENAGKIEFEMHNRLRQHSVAGEYYKDGKMQKTREMFKYSVEKAIKEINQIIKDGIA